MHELGIAQAVVGIALEQSAGRRVTRVHAHVGIMMGVDEGSLRMGFEMAAQGTRAEGARLRVQQVPAVVACPACGATGEIAGHPLRCPSCGDLGVDLTSGDQLVVHTIDVEEAAT